MSYLSGHLHDVFVSYAHGPKTPLFRGEEDDLLGQWSRQLIKDLSKLIAVKLCTKDPARQVNVWMDPALAGNDPLNETLQSRVQQSALLLVIMSPYYLQSQWCGKEVEWFSSAEHFRGKRRRIFVARAWWTDQSSWPTPLRELDGTGYSFLPHDEEEADPFGYPCSSEKDPGYWTAVKRLAADIAREIKALEVPGSATPRGKTQAVSTGGRVFLGFMSETLQDERSELHERLSAAALTVVPPAEEVPVDEASLRDAITTHLGQATALILMANEYPGLWPKGQQAGFISYQIQCAKEHNIPCYLWLRVDSLDQIKKREYREYLEVLSQQAAQAGIKLQYENSDRFVAHIQESLRTHEQPELGVEQLAVICANLPEDKNLGQHFHEAIRAAVQDTRREIFIFDFATSQEQVKLGRLGDRIKDADTVLVLCFDQEWDWARGLIREISGLRELRSGRRTKLLVAAPRDRDAGLYDASVFGFKTVNGLHLDLDRLKQLLKDEILTATPQTGHGV